MGKSKMIAKSCPKCDMQVAVASKSCKCGHAFFSTRRSQDVSPSDEQRRRTSRVRRGKPQFYDSQDYQRQKRKTPKKRSLSHGSIEEEPNVGKTKESAAARARRRRALRRAATETATPPAPPAPAPPPLRPPQLARCALILAEINRKMTAVVWSPDS